MPVVPVVAEAPSVEVIVIVPTAPPICVVPVPVAEDIEPVAVPYITPVQTKFCGQHAMCPAESRAQFVLLGQQASGAESEAHEL